MESDLPRQAFLSLSSYNNSVKSFLEEIKANINHRSAYEFRIDLEVQSIKNEFSHLFGLNEKDVPFNDIMLDLNPFETFLYWALNSHWDLIKLTDSKTLLANFARFHNNLVYASSNEFYDIIVNESFDDVSRSLSRTLALYFYIRAPSACFVSLRKTLKPLLNDRPVKISEVNDSCVEYFYSLATNEIVTTAFRKLNANTSIDSLFQHICTNSFYTFFPHDLYGLTTIGDYVFICDTYDETVPIYHAATLVTLLHESAHLSKRLGSGQSSYFKITPEKDEGSKENYDAEIGDFFEKQIFGRRLEFLNDESALFLMEPSNWQLGIDEFQREFQNKFTEGELAGSFKVKIGKSSNFGSVLRLGRCGMATKIIPRNLTLEFNN